jgi:GTP cyclohydrolase I
MNQYAERVQARLIELGIETPMYGAWGSRVGYEKIREAQVSIMTACGLDLKNDSLSGTPDRIARMYGQEIFKGLSYDNFPECTTQENTMKVDELILCRSAKVRSVCEHHFVPFLGIAHVAYIPTTKLIGLSKIYRVVDFFSRRPQVQERLTAQIHAALEIVLETPDVAVIVRAQHMCVALRGIMQEGDTITSKMGGRFMERPALRQEFLSLIQG